MSVRRPRSRAVRRSKFRQAARRANSAWFLLALVLAVMATAAMTFAAAKAAELVDRSHTTVSVAICGGSSERAG